MKSNNNAVVPEAREALDKFKMEAAADLDVPAPSRTLYLFRTEPQTLLDLGAYRFAFLRQFISKTEQSEPRLELNNIFSRDIKRLYISTKSKVLGASQGLGPILEN